MKEKKKQVQVKKKHEWWQMKIKHWTDKYCGTKARRQGEIDTYVEQPSRSKRTHEEKGRHWTGLLSKSKKGGNMR